MDVDVVLAERDFCGGLGLTSLSLHRELEALIHALSGVVCGHGDHSPEQRALASRALARLGKPDESMSHGVPLGLVDDFLILGVAYTEIFPEGKLSIDLESMLDHIPASAKNSLVAEVVSVLESPESFTAEQVASKIKRAHDQIYIRDQMARWSTPLPDEAQLTFSRRLSALLFRIVDGIASQAKRILRRFDWILSLAAPIIRPLNWLFAILPRGAATRIAIILIVGGAFTFSAFRALETAIPGFKAFSSVGELVSTVRKALAGSRTLPQPGEDPLKKVNKALPR